MADPEPPKQPSTSEPARTDSAASVQAPAFDPAEMLGRIWRQNLPIIRERLACLDAVAEAASQDALTPARRTEASDIAHKLAGSLGMFGYPQGTQLAREMEDLLEAAGPVDGSHFTRLTVQLRSVLSM